MDLKTLYIDGTKIESTANRYTFVWRKSVEKNPKKLMDKMILALGLPDDSTLEEIEEHVKTRFNEIRNLCSRNRIIFVHGIGRRKTQEQRDYEDPKEVVERFATYRNHLALMGIRNSYSKTDHDATFMRMKEDHILNGQLKPANYETKKKRKTKQNIGHRDNLLYREDQDAYVGKAGKHLARGKDRKTKTASGFVDIVWTYTCCEPHTKKHPVLPIIRAAPDAV